MDIDTSDENYPIVSMDPRRRRPAEAAAWLELLAQRARAQVGGEWDCMVLDVWGDSNRIIGHVQMIDRAIGYDTGFRVCARTCGLGQSSRAAARKALELVTAAVQLEPAQSALSTLHNAHPFTLWVTSRGEGRITDAHPVTFR